MKNVNKLIILWVALAFIMGGCSSKTSSDSPAPNKAEQAKADDNQQGVVETSNDESKKTEEEAAIDKAVEKEMEEEKEALIAEMEKESVEVLEEKLSGLSNAEKLNRLVAHHAFLVSGVIFYGASFPVEAWAKKAHVYFSSVLPGKINAKSAAQIAAIKERANKRIFSEVYAKSGFRLGKVMRKRMVALKKTLPGLSEAQLKNLLFRDVRELDVTWRSYFDPQYAKFNAKVAKQVAHAEARASRKLYVSGLFSKGANGTLRWGVKGLRYVIPGLMGLWVAYDAFDLFLTSDLSSSEITAEDRLEQWEKATRNFSHDSESIENQKDLVEATQNSLPDVIESTKLDSQIIEAQITEVKADAEISDSVKETVIEDKTASIEKNAETIELHNADLNLIETVSDPAIDTQEKIDLVTDSMGSVEGEAESK